MQTFYSHIEKNRRSSFIFKLIFFIGFAIIGTIVAEIVAFSITVEAENNHEQLSANAPWLARLCGYVFVLLIILGSYFWHKSDLNKGVKYLFEKMGHVSLQDIHDNLLLERDQMTIDLPDYQYDLFRHITPRACKTLSNIVEEMAIAANVQRPQIFVDLTSKRINACTLGLDRNKAGISVTFGALTSLTRDEMQGVIAHEFSHIYNGDTETNMKAVAAISGMTVIGDIGVFIMNMAYGETKSYHTRTNTGLEIEIENSKAQRDKEASIAFTALFLGFGVFICGVIGVFFGEFMKRAISRKNEYIADATAVKYTRNPTGLVGALLKIASEDHPLNLKTSPYSHMYFAPAFSDLLDTHPSIKKRIKALESIAGKGEIQAIAQKIYRELNNQTKSKVFETLDENTPFKQSEIAELNKAIVAATVVAQTYDMNLVPDEADDPGLCSSNFTNLAQAVSALIRVLAQNEKTLSKLALTAPANFRRELNRGLCSSTDKNVIFNIINKSRAFYNLSAELIQTQARTLIQGFITEEPQNNAARALCILFTTETIYKDNKFNQAVYEAMVPRLFGFILKNAAKVSEAEFTSIYATALEHCGVKYTEYIPFPIAKLNMVLTSFCELDAEHFRLVTEAIDAMFSVQNDNTKSKHNIEVTTIRALLEAHCDNHETTDYAIDATEAVIIQEQMRSVSEIMREAGLEQGNDRKVEREQKRTYDTFLKIISELITVPEDLTALSNIYDYPRINAIIAKLKDPEATQYTKLPEKELMDLILSFKQSYDMADIICKRGMHIAYQRVFNTEPQNSKLAYFSLIIDIREVLNSSYKMSEENFSALCSGLFNYLATNSTPTYEKTRQDFVNEACHKTDIKPVPYKATLIKSVFANLLEMRTATNEQKARFKKGFEYIIQADNDITEDERFLNFVINTIIH